jgi:hypothetical protein
VHQQSGLGTHLPSIGDITTPMQSIFDTPMSLLQGEQVRGIGFLPKEIGYAIDRISYCI